MPLTRAPGRGGQSSRSIHGSSVLCQVVAIHGEARCWTSWSKGSPQPLEGRGEEAMGETWSSWLLLSVFESRGWLATTGPAEHNIGGQQHTCACDFYCPRSRSRGDGERRTTRRPSRTAEGAKAAWSASESKFRGAARGVQAHRYCGRIMACGS